MLFNSYQFLFVYFPIVFAGYFLIARWSHVRAAYWLAIASLFFYGWWSVKALPLLLASILANFYFSKKISNNKGCEEKARTIRQLWLIFAVTTNISLLAFFKYANFFVENVNLLAASLGGEVSVSVNILLPIGISFYTFTQIAFLVDCWQGKVNETRFGHYVLFVSYFPHLIAGPVLHHDDMMPQFRRSATYKLNYDAISVGLAILVIGLAKKLLIADTLSGPADTLFNSAAEGSAPQLWAAWLGMLAYSFQIYFDFSGYSDMAIGISLCFGIKLPINFNSPYKARSIIEFWRCWHVTLSVFLRDYLYIPLGGNKNGRLHRYVNLLVTMVLGGLWHGASWTFVLWGGVHGVLLMLNHAWRFLFGRFEIPFAGPISWLLTFVSVILAWVLFRAESIKVAMVIYGGLLGRNGVDDFSADLRLLFVIAVGFAILLACKNTQQIFGYAAPEIGPDGLCQATHWYWAISLLMGMALFLCMLRIGAPSPFLYFQF